MNTAPDLEKRPHSLLTEVQPPTSSNEKLAATADTVAGGNGLLEQSTIPTTSSKVTDLLQNLREQKREIVHALVGEDDDKDFSEDLHRLYRLNIRYHRMSLIKHSVQLYSMDTLYDDGSFQYIQDSHMKAIEVDLHRHCK